MRRLTREEFDEIASKHEKWLEGEDKGEKLILKDADLSGLYNIEYNLSYAKFENVIFDNNSLYDVHFDNCLLYNCTFKECVIDKCTFNSTYISELDLENVCFINSIFKESTGKKINFNGVNFHGVCFVDNEFKDIKGLISQIDFLENNFEKTSEGYIAYKTFGMFYSSPEYWDIKEGSIINETVDFNRFSNCGRGINVATLDWIKRDTLLLIDKDIWKVLIPFEWLSGVCVPYNSNGKIRCERVKLLEKVESFKEIDYSDYSTACRVVFD